MELIRFRPRGSRLQPFPFWKIEWFCQNLTPVDGFPVRLENRVIPIHDTAAEQSLSDFHHVGCLIDEMIERSDIQLLRDYAGRGDEAAFRVIVARHADLVYSAAVRELGSSDLAGDVAQIVFSDLARKARPLAGQLAKNVSRVGWLYRGTRFESLNQWRADHRRLAREREAMEQLSTNAESAPDWERIHHVLDEAPKIHEIPLTKLRVALRQSLVSKCYLPTPPNLSLNPTPEPADRAVPSARYSTTPGSDAPRPCVSPRISPGVE